MGIAGRVLPVEKSTRRTGATSTNRLDVLTYRGKDKDLRLGNGERPL
jgi:hypothetical protein